MPGRGEKYGIPDLHSDDPTPGDMGVHLHTGKGAWPPGLNGKGQTAATSSAMCAAPEDETARAIGMARRLATHHHPAGPASCILWAARPAARTRASPGSRIQEAASRGLRFRQHPTLAPFGNGDIWWRAFSPRRCSSSARQKAARILNMGTTPRKAACWRFTAVARCTPTWCCWSSHPRESAGGAVPRALVQARKS